MTTAGMTKETMERMLTAGRTPSQSEIESLRQQLAEAQCLLQQAKEGLQSAVSFQTTMEKLLLQLGYTAESLELDKQSKAQKALIAIDQAMREGE